MKSTRCEEVLVTLVIRTYDEAGRPTDERVVGQSNGTGGIAPIKIFRNADTRDFWSVMDAAVATMLKQPPAPPAPPAAAPAKKRGRG